MAGLCFPEGTKKTTYGRNWYNFQISTKPATKNTPTVLVLRCPRDPVIMITPEALFFACITSYTKHDKYYQKAIYMEAISVLAQL